LTRPIAVAATAAFGADVLERLARHHEVTSVLTRPDAPAGRGRKLAASPAKMTAERLGLRFLEPEDGVCPAIEHEVLTGGGLLKIARLTKAAADLNGHGVRRLKDVGLEGGRCRCQQQDDQAEGGRSHRQKSVA